MVRPHARCLILAGAIGLVSGIATNAHATVRQRNYESTHGEGYEYVSPGPGSALISPRNNIAFRQGSPLDESSLGTASFTVTGAASGLHRGALALSDDAKTVVFRPDLPFDPGEEVEVELAGGIRTRDGGELPRLLYQFTVSPVDPSRPWDESVRAALSADAPLGRAPDAGPPAAATQVGTAAGCELPDTYPPITLLFSDHPEPGNVFLSPFRTIAPGHLVIVDNLGNPLFYRRIPNPSTDFKVQPDGRLTYFSQETSASPAQFYAMDASYAIVDSFATGNGYVTDSHDLQLLPDGHALLLSYDPEPVRMDTVIAGGRRNAVVIGLIVQELDASKNVVFQWRSWDHFKITDATSALAGLFSFVVDYVHGNAIELDHDGNLLLSCRHLCEITKIDRKTGDILWRMGPHASRNQFTFVGDDRGFSHQHDVRRLPNGHITVFDNGNFLSPQFSRALEFEVDETAKVATLVWEYRHDPVVYGSFMGDVQRHASGGTMIGWGGADPTLKLTELHADGTRSWELGMAGGTWTYRAFRFPFRTTRFTTDVTALGFGDVLLGQPVSRFVTVRNPSPEPITIGCVLSTEPAFEADAPLPATLGPGGSMEVEVRFRPVLEQSYSGKLYVRSTSATELIAQDVELTGAGVTNRPPDCTQAHATPDQLWPPNHDLTPIAIEGVTDPDGDPVTIEITSITQDENLDGSGASACPAAVIEDGRAWVRAERDGGGDGRVYRIGFTARDPRGAACDGTVRVCVPHDHRSDDPDSLGGAIVVERCREGDAAVNSLEPCGAAGRRPTGDTAAHASLGLNAGRAEAGGVAIELTLPEEGAVTLAVYDLAGRQVALLDRGTRSAGAQRIVWNTAGVAPGMYFLRLHAGSVALHRPVLVLR